MKSTKTSLTSVSHVCLVCGLCTIIVLYVFRRNANITMYLFLILARDNIIILSSCYYYFYTGNAHYDITLKMSFDLLLS